MKTVAIVQARMGSTRLPGKVMMDLSGDTVLSRVVRRIQRAALINETVIATTNNAADDAIVAECNRLEVPSFRGSEKDVLGRYREAARAHGAEAVVRITSDCPLIDPELVDKTIAVFGNSKADYADNVTPRTYPRGLDVEAFTAMALERAWNEAHEEYQREHVTPYFYENPHLFQSASFSGDVDYSQYRWTLDTPEDLELIRAIFVHFSGSDDFSWRDVLRWVEQKPELAAMNAHVRQKPLRID